MHSGARGASQQAAAAGGGARRGAACYRSRQPTERVGDAEETEGDGEGEAGAESGSVLVEGFGASVGLED